MILKFSEYLFFIRSYLIIHEFTYFVLLDWLSFTPVIIYYMYMYTGLFTIHLHQADRSLNPFRGSIPKYALSGLQVLFKRLLHDIKVLCLNARNIHPQSFFHSSHILPSLLIMHKVNRDTHASESSGSSDAM